MGSSFYICERGKDERRSDRDHSRLYGSMSI